MKQAEVCARYHINAGRSATSIVATDSVFFFKGQSETWLSFSHLELTKSHKGMYKLSYVVRVSADDLDELKRRCDEVKDFYDDLNVKLVRPAGDMLGLASIILVQA